MSGITVGSIEKAWVAMSVEDEANAYLDVTYGPSETRWPISKTFVELLRSKFDREPLGREKRPKLKKLRKHA